MRKAIFLWRGDEMEDKMKVPLFDLTRQYEKLRKDVLKKLDAVFTSGNVVMGSNVKALEEEIAKYINVKYAIGVANGSDALRISVQAMDIKEGDYVITTPYTFFATASAIVMNGATPIFVDVEDKYYNLDLDKVEDLLENHPKKEKIKAIIPVHLFGKTVDLERLERIRENYNIKIIEDAAQSIGSVWHFKNGERKFSGSIGDLGIFSFFPTKNLGGYGDGGMVVTNNADLADRIRKLRVHGAAKKYYHDEVGYNSRLDEVQAAILRIKLNNLDEYIDKRIKKAKNYEELFELHNLNEDLSYPAYFNDRTHVYHQYVVTLNNPKDRDKLKKFLENKGVGTSIYYPLGLHLQKCFENLGYKEGDFPVAENASKSTLALPMFPELTKKEQEYVVKSIKEFFSK
jgi:dTDP-4-amino-4,6-dideoxygalactose transaminase